MPKDQGIWLVAGQRVPQSFLLGFPPSPGMPHFSLVIVLRIPPFASALLEVEHLSRFP